LDDLPDTPLYFLTGHDSDGLPVYRCARGTNGTAWGSWNAGFELSDRVLADFRHRHNIRSGHRNRANVPWFGFYDLGVVENIQRLGILVYGEAAAPVQSLDSFVSSGETFGVPPLVLPGGGAHAGTGPDYLLQADYPPGTRGAAQVGKLLSPAGRYLAKRMHVVCPPMPISGKNEVLLFNRIVASHVGGGSKLVLNREGMAEAWIKHVNPSKQIWPKLPSQLGNYFTRWTRAANRDTTLKGAHAFSDEYDDFQDYADDDVSGASESFFLLEAPESGKRLVGQSDFGATLTPKKNRYVSVQATLPPVPSKSASSPASAPPRPVVSPRAAPAPVPVSAPAPDLDVAPDLDIETEEALIEEGPSASSSAALVALDPLAHASAPLGTRKRKGVRGKDAAPRKERRCSVNGRVPSSKDLPRQEQSKEMSCQC
jgi:hypothetical protein